MDRATGSGPVGRGFESLRAHTSLSLVCSRFKPATYSTKTCFLKDLEKIIDYFSSRNVDAGERLDLLHKSDKPRLSLGTRESGLGTREKPLILISNLFLQEIYYLV